MTKKPSYKETLNLPKTDFPMKAKLSEREPEMVANWEKSKLFSQMVERNLKEGKKGSFVVHDGPPYANGHIHLGHVLNKVLKDVVVKSRNLMGYSCDFIPGWDCHGLPIELQVVKSLGKKRKDLSVSQFRDECRSYAGKFIDIQREEFKRLGILGRWKTPYLTMRFSYQANILRELAKIVEEGFVYKDKKPIHWCISCATALAEAEIEYDSHTSPSIYVNFHLNQDERIEKWVPEWKDKKVGMLIWTTTPWTLPANLAIAVHPTFDYLFVDTKEFGPLIISEGLWEKVREIIKVKNFEIRNKVKGSDLKDLTYQSHLNGRTGKVILGDYVTLEQGTGLVHTAPGHGYDDYLNGLKNGLEIYAPVDDRGRFTDEVKHFSGLKVFEANPKIIDHLQKIGFLLAQSEINHSYPHCWRCKKPVIFRATPQWFVSMNHHDLRKKALTEIEKRNWIPPWGKDRIYGMIENRPDWCLSRQRAWGIPIPAVYCQGCKQGILDANLILNVAHQVDEKGANCWYDGDLETFLPKNLVCPHCNKKKFHKETDILDVWFDSGVSFAAVSKEFPSLGFPVDLYLEGSDQHRGWFHSALLISVMTRNRAPYNTVLTHGFVVDGKGRKMSKSAGNYISAQDAVKEYGAEILRLWVCAEDYRDDIRISKEIMLRLTEAYRKIRNTSRFLLGAIGDFEPEKHKVSYNKMTPMDQWILDRLDRLTERVLKAYEECEFHILYHSIYNFCIVDLSSLYLDILKDRLYVEHPDDPKRRSSQTAIWEIVRILSNLMAPVLSVTSEEIWSHIPNWKDKPQSVFLNNFHQPKDQYRNDLIFNSFNEFLKVRADVSKALELARKGGLIGQSLEAKIFIEENEQVKKILNSQKEELPLLFIVSQVEVVPKLKEAEILYDGENIKGLRIGVSKAQYDKCARCWNYRERVGKNSNFPDACPRCVEVLKRLI